MVCNTSCYIESANGHFFCDLQALKAESVEFIVAPYEADAQMAYLALNGMVHAVSPISTYIHTSASIAVKQSMEGAGLVHAAIVNILSMRLSHHGLRTLPIPIRTPTNPSFANYQLYRLVDEPCACNISSGSHSQTIAVWETF